MDEPLTPDIAVLASFSGEGGVERMILNLVNAFAEQGYRVHLLLIRANSRHLDWVHSEVKQVRLGSRHHITSLWPLMRYLRTYRPPCMLVAKDRAGRLAVLARGLTHTDTAIFLRLGTNLSAALSHRAFFQRWLRQTPMRLFYPKLERVIAVSRGVANDTITVTGIDPDRVSVVRNPVLTPRLVELSTEPAPHPWLQDGGPPVILGVGRLTLQKDFTTLVRAFARTCQDKMCRLIILGEGRQEERLRTLAEELGVSDRVDLPGFTSNPYVYMARADLFVLSSRWEGSPNVLTEAMCLGTPVVSTNCPSGPEEILDGGRIAPLVPVGDWKALADAISTALISPPDRDRLRQAVREYQVGTSANRYLEIMGLSDPKTGS